MNRERKKERGREADRQKESKRGENMGWKGQSCENNLTIVYIF
jgi:hypothetical protein